MLFTSRVPYSGVTGFASDWMRTRIPELPDTETQMEYFMDFSAGGFGRLLFRWIENEMEELPDVYAKKASDSILCFMRTAESPRTKPAK